MSIIPEKEILQGECRLVEARIADLQRQIVELRAAVQFERVRLKMLQSKMTKDE